MIIAMVSVQDDLIETTQNINTRYIIKVIFREAGFIGFCPLGHVCTQNITNWKKPRCILSLHAEK